MESLLDALFAQPYLLALAFLLGSVLLLVGLLIFWGRGKHRARFRPLPAFSKLEDHLKRAAEAGKSIHIALGNGGVYQRDGILSLAGLQALDAVVDAAVAYQAPPIITVGDPTLLPIAQDILRRAYERRKLADQYDPSRVRFVAPDPIAYAGGAGYNVTSEDVIANVAIGSYGAEIALIADAGTGAGVPQLAGAADPSAIAGLYPSTDQVAMGEEMFAAGAQISGDRKYLASLIAQDVLRILLVVLILLVTGIAVLGSLGM